jgi:hypothetical protein
MMRKLLFVLVKKRSENESCITLDAQSIIDAMLPRPWFADFLLIYRQSNRLLYLARSKPEVCQSYMLPVRVVSS